MTSYRKHTSINSNVKFQNIADSAISFNFDITGITGSKSFILPNADTTLLGTDTTQTITNKTIDALNNTLLNISNSHIASSAAIDASKIANGAVSNTEFQYLSSLASAAVGVSDTQTLTNKTLTSPILTAPQINDSSADHQYVFAVSELSADRTVSLPLLAANDTFVFGVHAQTLTNKTIDADNNTITNIANAEIKAGAAIDAAKIANGTVSNTEFQHLAAVGSAVVGESDTQTLTNKTMGDNLNLNSNKITNLAYPTVGTDAANKSYVDDVLSGLDVKESVKLSTTADLDSNASISGSITYSSTGGTSSRGQITATLASSDTFTVDGVDLSSSDDGSRILLKDQATPAQNGIWEVTISGTSLTLDRATDFDEDDEVTTGTFAFVEEGTVNASSGWVLTTSNPIIVGGASGSSLAFSQFSGAGSVEAGSGMTKSGNTMNVIGSSTIISNADSIEVNSSNTANQILLSSGTAGSAATFGTLPLANSNAVSGVLGFVNGGTNASSFSSGSRLVATNSGNTALEDTSLIVSEIETKKHDSATTSNASQTTISTIGTSSDMVYLLQASIVANGSSTSEAAGFIINALIRNDSGTLTLVETDFLEIKDSSLKWDSDIAISGTNILIKVTGEAAKSIDWTASYNTLSV